jgi:hypothetical protein
MHPLAGFQNKLADFCLALVLEISILLSFLHSKLSNKVIFPQPALLYILECLFIYLFIYITSPFIYTIQYKNNTVQYKKTKKKK